MRRGRPLVVKRQGRIGVEGAEIVGAEEVGRHGRRRRLRRRCSSPIVLLATRRRGLRTAPTRCARSSTTPATSSPARTSRSTASRSAPSASVTPTPQAKAAVVLNINNPGFKDFRADASCTIRPQALIGEKYVDCLPTQPRVRRHAAAAAAADRSPTATKAPASTCCRCTNTHSPVDVDLLGDINRLPERAAPHDHPQRTRRRPGRARQRPARSPQTRQPGAAGTRQGARDPRQREPACSRNWPSTPTRRSAPFAEVRARVADFIVQSNTVAQASAATRGALARNLADCSRRSSTARPRDANASGASPNRRPRCSPTSAVAAPGDQPGLHQPAGVLATARSASSRTSARPRSCPGPALVGAQPLLSRCKPLGDAGQAVRDATSRRC